MRRRAQLVGDGVPIVDCSARAGTGVEQVRAAIAPRRRGQLPGARPHDGPAVLHVDRSFTIHGAGTVVTGTLWSGSLGAGDRVTLLPSGQRRPGARASQVHDAAVERARAGQRVAVNLAGVRVDAIGRGDVVAGEGAGLRPAWILDVALELGDADVAAPRADPPRHARDARPHRRRASRGAGSCAASGR